MVVCTSVGLILTTLCGRSHYYTCMVTEETEAQEVKGFLWVTEPGCGGVALELSQVVTLTLCTCHS